jgi:hypothetical protein
MTPPGKSPAELSAADRSTRTRLVFAAQSKQPITATIFAPANL